MAPPQARLLAPVPTVSGSTRSSVSKRLCTALRWLDAEGARTLLSTTGPAAELQLAGLTELDAASAHVLATFGGIDGVRNATVEDLCRVEGINRQLAEQIYNSLR